MGRKDKVFISYRRSASKYAARLVHKHLRDAGFDVFMDVESIDSGEFGKIILNQIAARGHFLAILAPGTMERLEEPKDWMRREMEYALDLERNFVPILFDEFKFEEHKKYLKGKLKKIKKLNALTIHDDYFDAGMEKLISRFLKQPVYGKVKVTPEAEEKKVKLEMQKADSAQKPIIQERSAEKFFNTGYKHYLEKFKKHRFKPAIEYFSKAIELEPDYVDAYYYRGRSYFRRKEYISARNDFKKVLEIDPTYEGAELMYQGSSSAAISKAYKKLKKRGR